eukprot:227911-Prymnesium_polylepis.1
MRWHKSSRIDPAIAADGKTGGWALTRIKQYTILSTLAMGTPDPQKVQHPFQRFQAKIKLISRTIECTPENSSDLERAPGARSIGDEFS